MRFCAEFLTLFTLILSWLVANLAHLYYNQSDPRSGRQRQLDYPAAATEDFHSELESFGDLGPSTGTCVNCGEPQRQRRVIARQYGPGYKRGQADDFLKVLLGFLLTSIWVIIVTLIINSNMRHRMNVRFIIQFGLNQFAISRRQG